MFRKAAERFGKLRNHSEGFRMVRRYSEQFGILRNPSARFRTLPHAAEQFRVGVRCCPDPWKYFCSWKAFWLSTTNRASRYEIIIALMKSVGELIKEKNIQLDTVDPVAIHGFTQVPNFILKNPNISVGAKVVYAMFLSYAWHNESCFPGQER